MRYLMRLFVVKRRNTPLFDKLSPVSSTPIPLPPGKFSAYLFDLDGTVADSMPLHYVAWSQAIAEHGGRFPEDLFYAMGGMPLLQVVEELNRRFGFTMNPEEVVARKESLYLAMLDQLQPMASVVAHIERAFGSIPFAIVSGSPRETIFRSLTTLGLLDRFPVIVGSEDYTHGKPNPEPFLMAARMLNVSPSECLVFEDAQLGIDAAEAAGMQWVRVPASLPAK
jgi:HAD superfamily hydrolase (TIGR01509 family)